MVWGLAGHFGVALKRALKMWQSNRRKVWLPSWLAWGDVRTTKAQNLVLENLMEFKM